MPLKQSISTIAGLDSECIFRLPFHLLLSDEFCMNSTVLELVWGFHGFENSFFGSLQMFEALFLVIVPIFFKLEGVI